MLTTARNQCGFAPTLLQPCVCRLALSVERMDTLEEIDLSNNALSRLPDAVFARKNVQTLILKGWLPR